jgi:hypothetical protein
MDLSLPGLSTSGSKVEKKVKVEKKTSAETTTIKVERGGMSIHRCDMKVKVEGKKNES